MAKDWIHTLHKGAFHQYAEKHGGIDAKTGKIKESFIAQCKRSKDVHVRRMANAASTLEELRPD